MDEARSENKKRIEKIKQLDEIIHEVDDMTADGKITEAEIQHLREKLKMLERVAAEKQQQ
jgi:hypothetical protein